MLPIGDTIPRRNPPIAVWLLILANGLVFLIELTLPPPVLEQFFYLFGVVPARLASPITGRSSQACLSTAAGCASLPTCWRSGFSAVFYLLCGAIGGVTHRVVY